MPLVAKIADAPKQPDREILLSHHLEPRPIEDVASELGVSVAAAMKRYVRAIRRLTVIARRQLDLPSRAQVN